MGGAAIRDRWSKCATGQRTPSLVSAAPDFPCRCRRIGHGEPTLAAWICRIGGLLTLAEVADRDTFCGRNIGEVIAELPVQAGSVIRLEVRNANPRFAAI